MYNNNCGGFHKSSTAISYSSAEYLRKRVINLQLCRRQINILYGLTTVLNPNKAIADKTQFYYSLFV
ncbi:MAG: hypothetical protein OFPI_35030 [Osedax symbiont Rs2]|nr:MAG: hypothetical protein OFPI_35030 [Osedax symbiont Rs2]